MTYALATPRVQLMQSAPAAIACATGFSSKPATSHAPRGYHAAVGHVAARLRRPADGIEVRPRRNAIV